jgi:hypothetical protein
MTDKPTIRVTITDIHIPFDALLWLTFKVCLCLLIVLVVIAALTVLLFTLLSPVVSRLLAGLP